jgi:hypothetical protein
MEVDANPHALPRTQSRPQHSGDCDHVRAARYALGAGLGGAAFRLLVALADACGAGCRVSCAIVHDSARLRPWFLFSSSHGKRLGRPGYRGDDADAL